MTRLAQKVSLLAALSLLTSAATVSAECAWVLWVTRSHFKTSDRGGGADNVGAWRGERSPTRSGSGFDRICLVRSANPTEAGRVPIRADVSRASSGCSGQARRGASYPRGTAAPRPAGVAFGSGKSTTCSWPSGAPSSTSSTTGRNSAGTSASSTVASPRRKKGRQNRPHQARQGPEVDGTGRWRGYSAGSIPGRGVPGGGYAPRPDARQSADPGQARAVDRGSRLRQQRRAPLPQTTAHSAHHSRPLEQYPGDRSRRPVPATISPTLDRGAYLRLARPLPPADRTL
jgi:hypothetical protein